MKYAELAHAHISAHVEANTLYGHATSPLLNFEPGTEDLRDSIAVDVDGFAQFLVDNGAKPEHIQGMAVSISPPSPDWRGHVSPHEYICSGRYAHYPVVTLNPNNWKAKEANHVIRHEGGHLLQERKDVLTPPPYNRPEVDSKAREVCRNIASAMGTLSLGNVSPYYNEFAIHNSDILGGLFVVGSLGVAASLLPKGTMHSLLWRSTPREIGADIFSWHHRDFNPITIK